MVGSPDVLRAVSSASSVNWTTVAYLADGFPLVRDVANVAAESTPESYSYSGPSDFRDNWI